MSVRLWKRQPDHIVDQGVSASAAPGLLGLVPVLALLAAGCSSTDRSAMLGAENVFGSDAGGHDGAGPNDGDSPDAAETGATNGLAACSRGAAPDIPQKSPRVLLLAPASSDPASIAAHLQGLLAGDPAFDAPEVKAQGIGTTQGASLMSFWYAPEGRAQRLVVLDEPWTWVVLLDDREIALNYPELYFEGVRTVGCRALAGGAGVSVLMTWSPAPPDSAARGEIVYRVANGNALPVVPAGYAWDAYRGEAGQPSVPSEAFAAAASLYTAITGRSAATASYQPSGLPSSVAAEIASAAQQADQTESAATHGTAPYASVVQLHTMPASKELLFMDSGTSSEAIWQERMNEIVSRLGMTPKPVAIGSTNESKTFDDTCLANALPSFQQGQYSILFARDYSVGADAIRAAGGQTALQVQVWDRHADAIPADGAAAVEMMEPLSKTKRDLASQLGLAWIPYHIMFARLKTERPSVALTSDGTHATYPVGYGLAAMSVISRTSLQVPTDGLDQDTRAAVRLADETIRQLSALSQTGIPVPDDPATRPKMR